MNSFITTFFLTLFIVFNVVAPAPLVARDVYSPPVKYPGKGTTWKVGSRHNVTWDATNPPASTTNTEGVIFLSTNGRLDVVHPLASGFDITSGRQEIKVPQVAPGSQYQIVLMGDSGNKGAYFTIEA
ncbi:uncharacterized protein BT62DRAFT_937613 [Guyanagaster necrorhizus]|uniref:Yeast cell wall synthesis Kre9/Knh1-like N-terminal domain-containing protein n=1 Tax=Guyanagaster necrorhizus TaxID=856835 RepID=A0A9P8AMF0_9AGAR|nr:uncharacterized protein BT62DRAFT_937613 [Guyanagaster necrorhizus MCA 3950]KAG7440825.1 hypothetical protein BT62DRAFT_937613 [Guyanagaster necrorhizus MCA 3950]